MGRRSVIAAVGLVASLATPARAERPAATVQLEYDRREGAGSCPDARAVAAGVAERLGYEPFVAAASSRVRVTVLRRDRVFQARIEMVGPNDSAKAERVLSSRRSDCAELAATLELAIAIAIDPSGPPAPEPPARAAEAPAPAASGVVAHAPVMPAAVRPAPRPVTAQVAVAGVAAIGSAPVRNLGVAVRFAARRGNASLGLEGRADLPASMPLSAGDVSTSLLVASLVPCVHWRRVAGCALATGGVLRAAGHGLVDARHVAAPYVALGARLVVDGAVTSNLSWTAHADVSAPLTETELRVGGEELWTTPPVSVSIGLGLAFAFL